MNNETLPKLEELIDEVISTNNRLNNELLELKAKNEKLLDENETLQLEVLESEEKHKETSEALVGLLNKLQSAAQAN